MKRGLFFYMTLLALSALVLASCGSPESRYRKYLERGDSYFQAHDYTRARLEYKNAARLMPADPGPLYKLGIVEEADGNLQSALSAFMTAERQDPSFRPVLLKLAEFFLTAQSYDEARERTNKLLALDPDNASAHAIAGSLALHDKQFAAAQAEVDAALKNDPANVIAWSVRAGVHIANGEPQEALEVLEKAVALNPDELSFYLLKAAVYSEQGDVDSVAKTYRVIFIRAPGSIRFRFDLARILIAAGRRQEAADVYRETVEAFPHSPEARHRLIAFLEEQQGPQAAEQEILSYIAQQPDQDLYRLWLADLYARIGDDGRAIVTLKAIMDAKPDDQTGLRAGAALARLRLDRGERDLAQHLVDSILQNDINNREALYLRASLAFAKGDDQAAVADLRTVLRILPGAADASRLLAETFLRQGRTDLAIDTLLQALEKHPQDKELLVRLAQLYALRGEKQRSLDILGNVTATDPSYPVAWETMARLAIESRQWDRAEDAVAKLAALPEQHMTTMLLEGRIRQKSGRPIEAAAFYRNVIRKNPAAPQAAYALSALLETADTSARLKDVGDFLLSLKTDNAAVLTILGAAQAARGDDAAAESSFRAAIDNGPLTQDPYIALAVLLHGQDRIGEALDILGKAQRKFPADDRAAMKRAALLMHGGKVDEAITLYEEIIARNSMADAAANNLAQTVADYRYTDKAALDRARLVAERFIDSDNPYYLDTLGWVYYRQGRTPQALPLLARAVTIPEKPDPQLDYHYGAALLANGRKEEARKYLERAVSAANPYTGYEDARKLLASLG